MTTPKPFTRVTMALLLVIAVGHLLRVLGGWSVTIDGMAIPVWVSALIFVVMAGLSLTLWLESRP